MEVKNGKKLFAHPVENKKASPWGDSPTQTSLFSSPSALLASAVSAAEAVLPFGADSMLLPRNLTSAGFADADAKSLFAAMHVDEEKETEESFVLRRQLSLAPLKQCVKTTLMPKQSDVIVSPVHEHLSYSLVPRFRVCAEVQRHHVLLRDGVHVRLQTYQARDGEDETALDSVVERGPPRVLLLWYCV